MEIRTFDANSNILRIFIEKDDGSGDGVTGLTTASSGLVITTIADNEAAPVVYKESDSTLETISVLGTYAAPTSTKARFKLINDTTAPGIYEIQLADARFSVASAVNLTIMAFGVTGMKPAVMQIPLPRNNLYSANVAVTSLANDAITAASMAADAEAAIGEAVAANIAARMAS